MSGAHNEVLVMVHSHPHSDHHHETAHGSGHMFRSVVDRTSLLKMSALSRLMTAILLLVPLWLAVYWVAMS